MGNTLYLVAVVYYVYISFLGYSALPFLERSTLFLYPIVVWAILWVVTVALRFSIPMAVKSFYIREFD